MSLQKEVYKAITETLSFPFLFFLSETGKRIKKKNLIEERFKYLHLIISLFQLKNSVRRRNKRNEIINVVVRSKEKLVIEN